MSNAKSSQFQMVDERGWRRGMGNLLQGELSGWFKSRKWLKQILLWFLIVNLILFFTTIGLAEATKEALAAGEPIPAVDTPMLYGVFGGMFVAFGVMVIMQRVIVGEKRDGTAAWVLSKPVTRTAFVVSRLVGNMLGIFLTAVFVPGVIAYLTIGIFTPLGWLSPLNYLAGLAVVALSAFFWLTLTLMMGTIYEKSAGVIAIPMGLFFAMWLVPSILTPLMYITPVILTVGPGDSDGFQGVSTSLMMGESPFSWIPVISAVIFSAIFITVAIRRFNRQEF
jgi:ABC-2 type transport system permease protein